jgi:3-hydroxybutyryl-CoA dehydrogenase
MVPLTAREEKSGYLLNSMLVPFLLSAMDLLANGISDAETIDKAWTLGTGAPRGPFEILDVVGLITAKNMVLQYQKVPNLFDPLLKKMMLPYNFDGMLKILDKYIDEGKLGRSTGEGFYKYK